MARFFGVGHQDFRRGRHAAETCQLGDFRRRLAHHRRVDGPIGPEQESGQPVGLLFIQEVAVLAPHFLPDRLFHGLLHNDALFRGADGAVVKGLGLHNGGHGLGHVGGPLDIGRAVARTHADGRTARGIGGLDHAGAAGGQNQFDQIMSHQFLHRRHGGGGQCGDGSIGASGLSGCFGHNLHGPQRTLGRVGVGGEDNGVAGFQGDHGFIDHRGRGVGGRDDARNDAHGDAHIQQLFVRVLGDDADGLFVADGVIDRLGGESVLDGFVGDVAEARLPAGQLGQFLRMGHTGVTDGLGNPVHLGLIEPGQNIGGGLGLFDQLPCFLPGAQILVQFHTHPP